jgi:hypothetical protein
MERNMEKVKLRMQQLMTPIDRQLLMCDSQDDTLMLACAMMERAMELLDTAVGPDGTDAILVSAVGDRLAQRAKERNDG